MELCLGIVKLGMNYGIVNQKKPSIDESIKILDYATQNGINTIDTANAYGTSEDVLGEFLKKNTIARNKLFIISKFKPNLLDDVKEDNYYRVMKGNLEDTLSRIGIDYLDAYMLHSSHYVWNDAIIDTLARLKNEGYVRHCGVSVYETDEAKKVIERENCDFMQLPYSIFDQRMRRDGVFDLASKDNKTIIHSRSAFIQGLVLMQEDQVPEFLSKARPIVKTINEVCKEYNISKTALAMNYVKKIPEISHLVFGVDNLEQLKENITLFNSEIEDEIINDIGKKFEDIEADIVMPNLWKR